MGVERRSARGEIPLARACRSIQGRSASMGMRMAGRRANERACIKHNRPSGQALGGHEGMHSRGQAEGVGVAVRTSWEHAKAVLVPETAPSAVLQLRTSTSCGCNSWAHLTTCGGLWHRV